MFCLRLEFLMALGLISLTSKRRKVNKENSLGSRHASAHIMGDKDLRLKQQLKYFEAESF